MALRFQLEWMSIQISWGYSGRYIKDKFILSLLPISIILLAQTYKKIFAIHRSTKYWKDPHDFKPERFIDENDQCKQNKQWIPFQIGARICPGKSFSLELLFRLALKVVTELKLSFDGFVEKSHEKSTDINNLRYLGMSLVHHHPFTLKVENPDMKENKNNLEHCEKRRQQGS